MARTLRSIYENQLPLTESEYHQLIQLIERDVARDWLDKEFAVALQNANETIDKHVRAVVTMSSAHQKVQEILNPPT